MSDRDAAPSQLTELLVAWNAGDRAALDKLMPLVIGELRRMARRQLAGERAGHTLQPTALINEVYLRWSEQKDFGWRNRVHFFSLAAAQIRHILVDHARRSKAAKRGRAETPIRVTDFDGVGGKATPRVVDFIDLDRALTRLQEMEPQYSRIVELRYFAGLSAREVAEVLGVTERTVLRNWAWIKAWLFRQLTAGRPDDDREVAASQGPLRGGAREAGR